MSVLSKLQIDFHATNIEICYYRFKYLSCNEKFYELLTTDEMKARYQPSVYLK
jgi:hypothetical protein